MEFVAGEAAEQTFNAETWLADGDLIDQRYAYNRRNSLCGRFLGKLLQNERYGIVSFRAVPACYRRNDSG